jgi:hypothetical protein
LDRDQKEGSIATSYPRGKIWGCKQRVDLFPVEKIDRSLFVAFVGHRQYPLAIKRMGRFL